MIYHPRYTKGKGASVWCFDIDPWVRYVPYIQYKSLIRRAIRLPLSRLRQRCSTGYRYVPWRHTGPWSVALEPLTVTWNFFSLQAVMSK